MTNSDKTNTLLRSFMTGVLGLIIIALIYMLMVNTTNKTSNKTVKIQLAVQNVQSSGFDMPDDPYDMSEFDDGLMNPVSGTNTAPDDFGVGITSTRTYNYDINNDGINDRIIRIHIENGSSHFTNQYKIELATDNGFQDITPENLETIEGADCALQKIRFIFTPTFQIQTIGRNMQNDYITPTMAYQTIYKFQGDTLVANAPTKISVVCDVAELF